MIIFGVQVLSLARGVHYFFWHGGCLCHGVFRDNHISKGCAKNSWTLNIKKETGSGKRIHKPSDSRLFNKFVSGDLEANRVCFPTIPDHSSLALLTPDFYSIPLI